MKKILCLLCVGFALISCQCKPDAVKAAEDVVTRCFGFFPENVEFALIDKQDSCDVFALSVSNNTLKVEGSSPVALCKGFHDYLLGNGYGIVSWTGNRLALPAELPDMERVVTVSPYRHHLFFNVCTFGYSMPFWTWEEWEKQIDWMAMHGYDMPLMPTASEAILAKVWSEMGLTQEEIDDYFTDPAHFPWMRMGNMSQMDGPNSPEWYQSQIALAHQINERELSLGMKPVYNGFAGFVPRAMTERFPNARFVQSNWHEFSVDVVSPMDSLFQRIGSAYIKEWEKEFGKGEYYLIDCFNEMDIPFGEKGSQERHDALSAYSSAIFESVHSVNPDATWVMQGWILGYQRDLWDNEALQALLKPVPDNKMIIIDLGVDFNEFVWKNGRNWDHFNGFYGKQWIWSTVSNFGGRSTSIGNLEFYLNEPIKALNSPNRGNLVGYGSSPEGIENNEIQYEIFSSAGWSNEPKDLMTFLKNYSIARYGDAPEEIMTFWSEMLQSTFSAFSDNARWHWQRRQPYRKADEMNINEHYYAAIDAFLAAGEKLGMNPLYKIDALQWEAFAYCGRADEKLDLAHKALDKKNYKKAMAYEKEMEALLMKADSLLCLHPLLNLNYWENLGVKAGTSAAESEKFAFQARKIITTWDGTDHTDYACRVYGGLIEKWYIPRVRYYFDEVCAGRKNPNMRLVENIAPWF